MQEVKAVIDPAVMANTTLVPTLEPDLLVCDITQISTTHTGIITAVLIRNRLNRFWELTPLILFLKELLVRLRGRCEVVREAAELGLRGRHEQRGCGDRGDGVPPPADDARAIARADEHELWALGGTVNVDDSKALDLGELIVGFLYFMGFEFNYITTGASADWGFFNRVMVGER